MKKLAIVVAAVATLVLSGCSMFEEQMSKAKGLVGFADDKEVITTPLPDVVIEEITVE